MHTKSFTAVLMNKNEVCVVDITAPIEKICAKAYIQSHFPEACVIALIPGQHAEHAYVYGHAAIKTGNKHVDPFDITHIIE